MLFFVFAMTIIIMVVLVFTGVRLMYRKKGVVASISIQAGAMFMFGLAVVLAVLADPKTAVLLSPDRSFDTPQQLILAIPFACAIALAVVALVLWITNWLKVNEVRVSRDATSITLAWSAGGTIRKMSQPKGGFTKRLTGREPDLDSNPNPWTPDPEERKIG